MIPLKMKVGPFQLMMFFFWDEIWSLGDIDSIFGEGNCRDGREEMDDEGSNAGGGVGIGGDGGLGVGKYGGLVSDEEGTVDESADGEKDTDLGVKL